MFGGSKASLFLLRSLGVGMLCATKQGSRTGQVMWPVFQCWSSTWAKRVDLKDLGSNPTSAISSLAGYRLVILTSLDFGVHICKMGIIMRTPAVL